MSKYTYEQILEVVNFHDEQNTHFIPNNIFEDLQSNIKKSPHIAFAYGYYYLISWLYRNATYSTQQIDVKVIKELLGYSPTNKTMDYLIKNNGLLDEMGYTETTTNFPVSWLLDEYNSPQFTLINDVDDEMKREYRKGKNNRFSVKYPVRHFHVDEEDCEDEMLTGVFSDVSNTHQIDFEVFVHCMSIKELGTTAFYLYAYLKNKNQIFGEGYDVPLHTLSEVAKIPYQSLVNYLDVMRKYNLITVIHNQEYFSVAMEEELRKANTYITNDSNRFTFAPQFYKKIDFKTPSQHIEIAKKKEIREITLKEIPFGR